VAWVLVLVLFLIAVFIFVTNITGKIDARAEAERAEAEAERARAKARAKRDAIEAQNKCRKCERNIAKAIYHAFTSQHSQDSVLCKCPGCSFEFNCDIKELPVEHKIDSSCLPSEFSDEEKILYQYLPAYDLLLCLFKGLSEEESYYYRDENRGEICDFRFVYLKLPASRRGKRSPLFAKTPGQYLRKRESALKGIQSSTDPNAASPPNDVEIKPIETEARTERSEHPSASKQSGNTASDKNSDGGYY
jgi:hypothetical protein